MATDIDEVVDVTDYYPHALKAERRGANVLILEKLAGPVDRLDGEQANYQLTHYWLVGEDAELCRVQGDDYSYYTFEELQLEKQLFDQFDIV